MRGFQIGWLRAAFAGLMLWTLGAFGLATQSGFAAAGDAPGRTMQLRDALNAAKWEEMEPGLAMIRAEASGGHGIRAFRIDSRKFRFAIAMQEGPDGETVRQMAQRNDALLAINGGFFGEKAPETDFFPVGLLRIDGRSYSNAWKNSGGFLVVGPETLSIIPSRRGVGDEAPDVVQSKPVLIEPGGVWAMNTNLETYRPRTVICLLPGNDVVLAVVTGFGMSLFEAGWLMRAPEEGGYFDCDSAIAMDGGGSTQLWLDGRNDLEVFGDGAVHNAILVFRK